MPETELEVKNRLCRKCRNNNANHLYSANSEELECFFKFHPIEADGKDCGYYGEVK